MLCASLVFRPRPRRVLCAQTERRTHRIARKAESGTSVSATACTAPCSNDPTPTTLVTTTR
eukprot:2449502-Rhodomonas_salina.1